MLEIAKYINHLNQSISFGSDGIFITDSELRDYEWKYESNFDEITNFHKGVVQKKMKIIIAANTKEDGIKKRNAVFEIFERDVLANQPGRIYQDDYYLSCYVIGSQKSRWYLSERYLENTVTVISDKPDWIEEKMFSYEKVETEQSETEELKKYPYSYGYFYKNQISSGSIINNAVTPSDFILRIYGDTVNPLVMIGGNTYQVNVSINIGERLEINSREKSINLIHNDGRIENVFWSASKYSYIFEQISIGDQIVSWDGSFAFDLILINARSEPLWTYNILI